MRVTFYSAVVLVAAGSVVMGLDWMSAPMPPMPTPKNVVFVPPPPPPRVTAAPNPAPSADQSPPVSPAPVAPVAPVAAPVPAAPSVATPVAAAAKIRCDADACAAAYRSFRESDCTYNPSSGPRRLCTKGDPEKFITVAPAKPAQEPTPVPAPVPAVGEPVAVAPEVPGSIMAPEPGTAAPPQCNVSACAAAYRSFRESDCTFNPSSGPRRLCEK